MASPSFSETETIVPPSSLFVFWPGDAPPLAEEIRIRLAGWGTPDPDTPPSAAEETLWSLRLDDAERPRSALVWCEPVQGEHLALLDQVYWRSVEQEAAARSARWLVGVEAPLLLDRPTRDYQEQLRLCEAIGAGWSPVLFDASSLTFHTPEDIGPLTRVRTPPRAACLYSIHKVAGPSAGREATYWLHTHGLERAGVPDLEIFAVPETHLAAGCELIDAVADLWLEFGTPDPEPPFAVGRDLEVAWRPWQAAVAETAPAVGGWSWRHREPGHAGFRAVLVNPVPEGWSRRKSGPPLAVLERLLRADTILYKTAAETRRMAQLALERWGTFGTLFASKHPSTWRFSIKLAYPRDDNPTQKEHLWFDCLGILPGRIQGRLVSQPAYLRQHIPGEIAWHSLDCLSDWRIHTPAASYGPESADVLLE